MDYIIYAKQAFFHWLLATQPRGSKYSQKIHIAVDRQKKICYYKNDLNLQGINNNVKRKSEMV